MAQWSIGNCVTEESPFRWRGVVEGFYGPPYTQAQRLDMIEFLARQQCNVYLYAPKDDRLHRSWWREPYTAAALRQFRELIETGERCGVAFSAAVSPGLSYRYSDPADFEKLYMKYRQFADVGVTIFALLMDDIPGELQHESDRLQFASLAAAQADTAVRLQSRLSDVDGMRLWFCPTEYCGAVPTGYLNELGALLPRSIGVFWTGPSVCSRTIDYAYLQEVAGVLRRKPLIWDNYPVNDAFMTSELHLGPYEGRDPNLAGAAEGILLNPMIQPEASKIALATAAEYLAQPTSYDPQSAWKRAIAGVTGGTQTDAFGDFAGANTLSPLTPEGPKPLAEALAQVRGHFDAMDYSGAVESLASLLARMERAEQGTREISNAALAAEVAPWLTDYRFWRQLGRNTERAWRLLQSLSRAGCNRDRLRLFLQLQVQLERIRLGLRRSLDLQTAVCGRAIAGFAQETLRQISGVLSQQAQPGAFVGRLITLYRKAGARLKRSRIE